MRHYVRDYYVEGEVEFIMLQAIRARLRLALRQTPEVRVTMRVPAGKFSAPSKVMPNFNMPGGGMERTAKGIIPAEVLSIQ
jgi:hypothetical protein